MSSTFSWKRQMWRTNLPILVLVLGLIASVAAAETASVRLGPHFRAADGDKFLDRNFMSEVLVQIASDMQLFVHDVDNCRDLIAIPPGKEHGRDPTRQTSTIIQSIRVECWTVLQADPSAQVTPAAAVDRIDPGMIRGVMKHVGQMGLMGEKWARTFMSFSEGEITCKDAWRCRLSLPDGRSPPERSLDYNLIMAMGDERFIMVTQMVHGRSGFVYAVRWRGNRDGGEVISIFPDLR